MMFAGGSKTIFQNVIGRSRFGSSWLASWIPRMRVHRMINFWIFISVGWIWKRLKIRFYPRVGTGSFGVIWGQLTLSQLAAIFFLKFPDTVWILLIWFLLFSSGILPLVEPITDGSLVDVPEFDVPLCVGFEAPGTRFGLDSFFIVLRRCES